MAILSNKEKLSQKEAAAAIIEIGRRMYLQGLIAAADGNISCRLQDGNILITKSGVSKGFLNEEDLVLLSPEGNILSEGRPSIESSMHLAIYRIRDDINAICHAHPPYATAFACAKKVPDIGLLPEGKLIVGRIPLIGYATPGSEILAEAVAAAAKEANCALLQKHGFICWGKSPEEALFRMEAAEHLAKTDFLSRKLI